ncbi:MAG: glutathione binding-like protein [Pseudomonadota bacterium]
MSAFNKFAILMISITLIACGNARTHVGDADPNIVNKTASEMSDVSANPDIRIYHMEGRRSERIVWLLEELNMPYELNYQRGDLRATAMMLRAVNPEMPMFPTVFLNDQKMVESGAIIDVILNRYAPGKLRPALDSPEYGLHTMWMHYAEGTMAARLFSDYRQWRQNPPTERSRLVDSEATVQFAEDHLQAHDWFGGSQFSAADIMMLFPLEVATGLNLVDGSRFPAVAEWKEKVKARPAYLATMNKARPDGMIGSLPPVKQHAPSGKR